MQGVVLFICIKIQDKIKTEFQDFPYDKYGLIFGGSSFISTALVIMSGTDLPPSIQYLKW